MATINTFLDKYNRAIIFSLFGIIVLFLFACTFHDVLPICHWIFNCDHMLHM